MIRYKGQAFSSNASDELQPSGPYEDFIDRKLKSKTMSFFA